VQQVTATERELICAKPSFALKERLKVIFKKRPDLVVEDKVVPLAADNLAFAAADNVEAWLVVASIELFKQTHDIGGVLAAGDDESCGTLKVAAWTGVIGEVQCDRGELGLASAEAERDWAICP
jgi:hypothetical protein